MTRDELLNLHKSICKEAVELMEKKNHDYAGSNELFLNFQRVEALKICTVEQGFLVRLTDKLSRLITACNTGELKVKEESFKDTIIDTINYSILLYAYMESKKEIKKEVVKHQGNENDQWLSLRVNELSEDDLSSIKQFHQRLLEQNQFHT